jgi:hypothetical protein
VLSSVEPSFIYKIEESILRPFVGILGPEDAIFGSIIAQKKNCKGSIVKPKALRQNPSQ